MVSLTRRVTSLFTTLALCATFVLSAAVYFYSTPVSLAAAPVGTLTGSAFLIRGTQTKAINALTVTDSGGEITAASDIRIAIPAGLTNTAWDVTDTTAVINTAGNATGDVLATVSYETTTNTNDTLVLDVTSDFTDTDQVIISGLSIVTSGETTTAATAFQFAVDGSTFGAGTATIEVDATAPVVSAIVITPNGNNKVGDAITISITADAAGYSSSAITVNGVAITGFTDNGGGNYTGTYTIVEGNTDRASGTVPASVVLADSFGNTNTAFTTVTANTVAVDANSPVVSAIVITPNGNNKVGDAITISITADAAGYSSSAITVNGVAITGFTDNGGGNYTGTYTIVEGNTDRASGTVPASVVLADSFGNTNTAFTTVTANTVAVDANSPVVSAIVITPNGNNKVGDAITISITADAAGYSSSAITVNGVAITGFTDNGGGNYTGTYTIVEGNTDRASGTVPASVVLADSFGNTNTAFTTVTANTVAVDANSPIVSAIVITPNGNNKVGDAITISITADAAGYSSSAITVNGVAITGFTDNGGGNYTGTYTIVEGNTDRASGTVPASVVLADSFGNTNTAFTTVTANTVAVDANSPIVSAIVITPNGNNKVGDAITISITADAAGYSSSAITVNGVAITGFTDNGGGNYTGTYTIVEGNTDRASGTVPASVVLADSFGNTNTAFTTVTANTVAVDANSPIVSAIVITPNGNNKVGDAITISITADAAGYSSSAITVNGVAITGFTDNGGGNYTGTYTIVEGNTDRASGTVPASVVLADSFGNTNTAFTTVTANTVAVDANSPVVSATSLIADESACTGTGGICKIGDTITFRWNNSVDGNSDESTVQANLSNFGGSTTQQLFDNGTNGDTTGGDDIYTFALTIPGDNDDGTNAFSVTVTDTFGNSTGPVSSTDTAPVDNIAPIINTPGTIALTNDIGSEGVASIGDTVTYAIGTLASADGDTWTVNLSAYGLSSTTPAGGVIIVADDDHDIAFTANETATDNAGNVAVGAATITGGFNIYNVAIGTLTPDNVEPASLIAGVDGDLLVAFTPNNPFPANGKLIIDLPAGFDATGSSTVSNLANIDGTFTVSTSNGDGNNDIITVTRNGDGATTGTGFFIQMTLDNVRNPLVSGSAGNYSLMTTINAGVVIDQDTAVSADTILPSTPTGTSVTPFSLTANFNGTSTVSFTSTVPLPNDGKIVVTYPAGFNLNLAGGATCSSMDGGFTTSVAGQAVTITRDGTGTVEPVGAQTCTINSVLNPVAAGLTGTFSIQTTTNGDVLIEEDLAVPGVTITSSGGITRRSTSGSGSVTDPNATNGDTTTSSAPTGPLIIIGGSSGGGGGSSDTSSNEQNNIQSFNEVFSEDGTPSSDGKLPEFISLQITRTDLAGKTQMELKTEVRQLLQVYVNVRKDLYEKLAGLTGAERLEIRKQLADIRKMYTDSRDIMTAEIRLIRSLNAVDTN